MEIILEFFLTAFVALVFSFLIAKVVSLATGGDSVSGVEGKPLIGAGAGAGAADDDFILEQLEFAENLKVQGIGIIEKKVDFVKERVDDKVDVFEAFDDQGFESEMRVEFLEESSGKDGEFRAVEGEVVERLKVEAFDSEKEVELIQETAGVVEAEVEFKLNDIVFEEKIEEIGEQIEPEKESKVQCEEEEEVKQESYHDDDDYDDDWEGIEKSELENDFAAAAKFVEEKGNLGMGNDDQMELYGLHKIATEGPCREPQPLAFMVSSRSKCDGQHCLHCARNAWQRMGNMNPEVAMEQYVTLLSDKVPGWMENNSDGERKLESADEGVLGSMALDTNSFPDKQTIFTHERNADLKSSPGGGDITENASSEKQA